MGKGCWLVWMFGEKFRRMVLGAERGRKGRDAVASGRWKKVGGKIFGRVKKRGPGNGSL